MKIATVAVMAAIGLCGCFPNVQHQDKRDCSYHALQERLKRLHMGIESTVQYGKEVNETVFYTRYEPIKNFPVYARRRFRLIVEEALKQKGYPVDAKHIRRLLPELKPEDMRDTGCLRYQADFDIVLNRYIRRIGITPATPEHVDIFLDDLKQGLR